jgi:hypothetical protein
MGTFVAGCINSLRPRKFGAIYADPPWSFRNWSARGTGRNAISHYNCLQFEELAALPVSDLAADDCVLFLWAVDPLLDKAFELMRARIPQPLRFGYREMDRLFLGHNRCRNLSPSSPSNVRWLCYALRC